MYNRKNPHGPSFKLRNCNLTQQCKQDVSGHNPTLNSKLLAKMLVKELKKKLIGHLWLVKLRLIFGSRGKFMSEILEGPWESFGGGTWEL